jgi:hypothetical protein
LTRIFGISDFRTYNKESFILIPDDLKANLQKLDLSDPDNFLFGIEKPRSRNQNKLFKPSPHIVSKNAANNFWQKEVKNFLKIESNMYDLKKKDNNDKLELG